ncbi:serine hydrolase domain-containing protein [Sulfitobacter donghicola]|uniref:Beta-lactamase-related domain-containing protein n=1 Tax=Sulfitobacter donghicola DSW-25 = KCTC 12864 = JCM 14565 TaxID=1300350 RepID=A0A073IKL8_9RHOB|nr:serine hydrolase domain-containing protein [Sulfitobacter donghicola]KEJ90314.1 hypothetical protein DSW25_06885 [Sulfitobacter donghicola DSW-25 = KCTC 12864 = JCM 14565]KIN66942.1 putative beta-lactamase [Sulfitobacter donghicola DSW-25 = KCTC 12864 = JCM 14565]
MRLVSITAILALFATAGFAQPVVQTAKALETAFGFWASDNKIPNPTMVVMHQGEIVGSSGEIDTVVEIASLSKAITAVCAASLVSDGTWAADTTSADVLGYGPDGITVAQLITHTSGIGSDRTQTLMPLWVDSAEPRKTIATELALSQPLQGKGQFNYNNENYAILGQMIEVAVGARYQAVCSQRALTPAGVSAKPSPQTGGMLPWGGWAMSAQDYARFHYYWFGPQGAYGAGSPASLLAPVQGGAEYGLGMFERDVAEHRNFWHFGLWCIDQRVNAGAYAVIWKGEWSVVATYDACVDWDAMGALDSALVKVVYGL